MNLNEKLRELRHKSGLTQEAVAEHLSVSAQTVSKWERGVLSPDVSVLPGLAMLYRCSIDSMFGMESTWNAEHREEFKAKIRELYAKKDVDGVYRAWITEIELNPDDFRNYPDVMLFVLRNNYFEDAYIKRMILLASRAEKYCSDDDIRNEIYRVMLQICAKSDNAEIKEKAKFYYKKLPLLKHSREIYSNLILPEEELIPRTKMTVCRAVDIAESAIRQLVLPGLDPRDKLYYYEKAAALYEVLLDGRFGGFWEVPLLSNYAQLATLHVWMGDDEKGEEYVNKIFDRMDNFFREERMDGHSSLIPWTKMHNYTPAEQSCLRVLSFMSEVNGGNLRKYQDRIDLYRSRFEELIKRGVK